MALKKEKEELSHKTVEELVISLRTAKQDLLMVRTNIATRKEEDNNRSRIIRRRIARILTLMAEKQRPEAPAAGAEEQG